MSERGWYLRERRQAAGLTIEQLAERVGTSPGYLSDMEKGKRRHNSDWVAKFAQALDLRPPDLFAPVGPESTDKRTVPVVGYVGAGAEAHLFAEGQGPFDFVDAPEKANDDTVAVEIRGESLGPLFNTWLVFYDDVRSPVTTDLHGQLCVVGLPDGRVLVKQIKRAADGRFHLISNSEGPILDQDIAWAARVTDMRPR